MIKKSFLVLVLFFFYVSNSYAESTNFIDFTKVLNNSKAGAAAQIKLKKQYESESEKFKKENINIKKEETKIIAEKKSITNEEYLKKVNALRQKVVDLQKKKQESFKNIASSRNNAKQALLKEVNPIVKKYMEDNNIRLVLDKKAIILGDTTLEITDKIIKILNQQVSSLKFN